MNFFLVYFKVFFGSFNASDVWLRGFLWRNKLTFRRVTTTKRELHNVNGLIGNFFNSFRVVSKQYETGADLYLKNKLSNMDETSIYLDCPAKYTYAKQGSKRVKIDTHVG